MAQSVKIKSIQHITHDVLHIILEKPADLAYNPGQAVDFAINKPGWESEWRSFTFTSSPDDNQIEFVIKTYPDHKGVTNELLSLSNNDEILIGDVYGDITYKGEGVFIAGGAGVTPFIAILKQLQKEGKVGNSKLIFANKTKSDIIDEAWFSNLLGKNFINILSNEQVDGYEHGYVNAELINSQMDGLKYYYLCAPPPMMKAVESQLAGLGIKSDYIIKEGF